MSAAAPAPHSEEQAIEAAYASKLGVLFGVLFDTLVQGDPEGERRFRLGLAKLVEAKSRALECARAELASAAADRGAE